MEDLYLKENPFNLPHVDSNVESSAKESKDADVEASKVNVATVSEKVSDAAERTKVLEKGNSEKTLKSTNDKFVQKLRVDDKNDDDTSTCKNA
jgi:hypothetical protein